MNQGFDLGQYLQDARAEGEHNSEGSFTIAQDKALDKLAHFSLPGPYDWVLKIVQAVNAWNCEVLQIQQTRVATSFFLRPPEQSFPSDEEIIHALRQGSLESAGPVHELCIALRALVDQAQLSFVLATRFEGKAGEPIYSGDDISDLSDGDRKKWSDLPTDGLRLTVSHFKGSESFTGRYIPTLSNVARRNIEIAKVLEQRAFCSPTPILLDGREITNPLLNPSVGQNPYYRPLAFGHLDADSQIKWQSYPALDRMSGYARPRQSRKRDATWCLIRTFEYVALAEYQKAMDSLQGTFNLSFYDQVQHQVCYVRYGVISGRETIFNSTAATSCACFISADEFRSDLTGLSVNKDESSEEKVTKFLQAIIQAMNSLASELPDLTNTQTVNAQHAFQEQEKVEAVKELHAGFSIFTEGLLKKSPSLLTVLQEIERGWKQVTSFPFRKKLLQKWQLFLVMELRQMENDMMRERRET